MQRVTAAVVIEGGRLLLARRPDGDRLAGLWELPGGKVEPGETPKQCLRRELHEELDMESDVLELVATTTHHYDHGSFELLAYRTRRISEYRPRVHAAVAWVLPAELDAYPLAPADISLVADLLSAGIWQSAIS